MKPDKLRLSGIIIGVAALSLTLWGSSSPPAAAGNDPNASAVGSTAAVESVSPVIVMPAGTRLRIRLDSAVGTDVSRPGDHFTGKLAFPVVVAGATVLPTGSRVGGYIVDSDPSGRLSGQAVLRLRLNTVSLDNRTFEVSTATDTRTSAGHRRRNLAWIGGGSGGGLLIGALAGGPVGAVIGVSAGAAGGLAGEVITGRRQVKLPAETELTFHLSEPLTVPPVV